MGISKRGNQHLRSLLVHGARAVVRTAPNKTDPNNEWINQLRERRGFNQRNGCCRQQECTDHLGRASNRASLTAPLVEGLPQSLRDDREMNCTGRTGAQRA